jgi:AbrB family looped-hinge helix DNA binding protein
MLVKIKSNGQLTIPKQVMEKTGIKCGDYLNLSKIDGKIVLQKIELKDEITDGGDCNG